MLNICLTYDYELFLGENDASYEEILFIPTKKLSKVMTDNGAKGTFFADVCSALAYQKIPDNGYHGMFSSQIQQLIRDGHDVQLHIHSNWYCAKKEENELFITPQGYRIHDFGFDETQDLSVQKIVRNTKQYLEMTLKQVYPDYRCIAYRAGGFGVQPEDQLLKILRDNGIVLDSSVLPHMKADGVNHYDFTSIPNQLNWWVNPEKGYSISSHRTDNTIYEVPVLTLRPRLLEYIGKSRDQLSLPAGKPKGKYVTVPEGGKAPGKIKKLYQKLFDYRYISLDTRYFDRVMDDLKYVYKKYSLDKNNAYISIICHPKIADEARIDNIGRLAEAITRQPDKYKIMTFREIYDSLNMCDNINTIG